MLSASRAQAPTALVVLMSRAWLVPVSSWTRGVTPPAFRMVTLLSGSRAAHSPSAPTTFTSTYKSHSFQKSYVDIYLKHTYCPSVCCVCGHQLSLVSECTYILLLHRHHMSAHFTYTDKVSLVYYLTLVPRRQSVSLSNDNKEEAWERG